MRYGQFQTKFSFLTNLGKKQVCASYLSGKWFDAAANCIRQKASEDVNIIFGSTSNQDMNELALVQEIPLVILTPYLSR